MDIDDLKKTVSDTDFRAAAIADYTLATLSRQCSLLGRREVLTGKGKFGIFGDGKELPQLAMARAFKEGDFRSGYYRDQTFMMAIGKLKPEELFSAIYAHTDIDLEPMSGGRQMGAHYMTHSLDKNGQWLDLTKQKNSSSDISSTAGQMPRLLGLAEASKIYRNQKQINPKGFSVNGNEVAWGTIGNASTSEGVFFETINAAGVLQVPMVISVWDDEYGISVEQKHQTTKESISEVLKGFQKTESQAGIEIITVNGWDYTALLKCYEKAGQIAREDYTPVLIHVKELTQPQGHSTSGSHERYKSTERLKWEAEKDCNLAMRNWLLKEGICTEAQVADIEESSKQKALKAKQSAWERYISGMKLERDTTLNLIDHIAIKPSENQVFIKKYADDLRGVKEPTLKHALSAARHVLRFVAGNESQEIEALKKWVDHTIKRFRPKYSSHLYSESPQNPLNVKAIPPLYNESSQTVDGRVILRDNFDALLSKYPELIIFGEDSGKIGDVNQGLEGLQVKYGELRVADVGIREATIAGEAIGMAMRGLRPIAEIQYLDYLLYAMYTLCDDLASLHYRTCGMQKAPAIIRTRGHRLEGIFHAGSPMGGIVCYLRGMYILVPRNMTQAAGMYNTMLASDQPALVIECLNGYRIKEKMPANLGAFTVPVGKIEVLREGTDITMVSYGSTLRIVEQVARELSQFDISAEVIDCQTLIPFDTEGDILKSVAKTNRLLVIDEDVPGGASAYIMQNILEAQQAYSHLDSAPQTITAKDHRTAYGTDGDYFSKPNAEDIFEKVYDIMHEAKPSKYPKLF